MARLLALLMGFQAGLPPLDFSPLNGANKDAYIGGIQAALGWNYAPLTSMFERVISQTWTQHAASSTPVKERVSVMPAALMARSNG